MVRFIGAESHIADFSYSRLLVLRADETSGMQGFQPQFPGGWTSAELIQLRSSI